MRLPANTTLTAVATNNLSPLENAAGVTVMEDEVLQKKEKDDTTKIPEKKIEESKPSNSTVV